MEKAERASSDPDTSEPESEPGAEGGPRGCAPIPMRRRADAARKETAGKGGPERPGGGRLARVKAGFERRRDAAKERLGRMRERIGNVKQAASQKISQGFTRMRERRAKARERKNNKRRIIGTAEEERKLEEFKALIAKEGLDVPIELCTAGDRDATLMRFLRARKLNLEKAYEMLSNTVAWRKEAGVNDILTKPLPTDVVNSIRAHMPAGYVGSSYRSQPIYVQHLGQLDTEALERLGVTEEQYLHYHMQEMEYAGRCLLARASDEQGKVVDTCLNILDVEGISMGKLTNTFLRIFKAQMKIDQDNYPETNGGVFIVNAGWVMSTIMGIVGPFIDPKTRSKIHVITGDGKKCAEKLRSMKIFDDSIIPAIGIQGEPRQLPTPSMLKMDEEIAARAEGRMQQQERRASLDGELDGGVDDEDDVDDELDGDGKDGDDDEVEVDLKSVSPEVATILADSDAILEDLKDLSSGASSKSLAAAEAPACGCVLM